MAPDLTVHNICQGNKSSHLTEERDKAVYLFGLSETNSILVFREAGRHTDQPQQAECVKAAVCV